MKLIAIKVTQPLADFYITKISARDLLKISFSEQLQYVDEHGRLKGSQRQVNASRLREIGRYIDSVEMSFPNSIILAANYNEDGQIVKRQSQRWNVADIELNPPTRIAVLKVPDSFRTSRFLTIKISEYEKEIGFNYR
ncbi:hypothetical protein [Gaoshiqia sp. Z1-71]|uniref:hypothetical protein n=1 Tax=Gaoshiqia hydrogeniformans TaxID=3290090 RepID=UPI003BF8EA34